MGRLTRQDLLEECRRYISDVRGAFTDDEQLALAEGFRDLALQSLSQEAVRDDALEEAIQAAEKNELLALHNPDNLPYFPCPSDAIRALKREPNAAPTREESRQDWDAVLSAEPAPAAPDVAKMEEKVWKCKVGGLAELPEGADWPMRVAVSDAFKKVTGKDAQFCFSGWGATLTEPERAVVEKRLPIHGTLPPGASDD